MPRINLSMGLVTDNQDIAPKQVETDSNGRLDMVIFNFFDTFSCQFVVLCGDTEIWNAQDHGGTDFDMSQYDGLQLMVYDKTCKKYKALMEIRKSYKNATDKLAQFFVKTPMICIPLMINGWPFEALVDTGAQLSIISKEAAENCGILKLLDERFQVEAAGVGGVRRALGKVLEVELEFSGVSIPVVLTVFDGPSTTVGDSELIIGVDILTAYNANIDFNVHFRIRKMVSPLVSNIIEVSQICLVTVTVPFYSFLLFFMIDGQIKKVKELDTPFFKLCISSAGIDLCTLFANYFGAMFPKLGMFTDFYMYLDGIYSHLYFYIAWSTGICQAMSVSVLATNRLSAMILPGSYQKLWQSHRLWIAVAVQLIPGMLISCLTFFNTTELVMNERNGIVPKFVNKAMTTFFFGVGGFFLLSNCLYLTVAYCYLFIRLRKQNAKSRELAKVYFSKAKERTKRRERRLFIMCTIIVAVQFLIFLFFITKFLSLFTLTVDEFYLLYNALSDVFASINPYLLWIFSDSLRKHALSQLGLQRSVTPINTTMMTIQ